MREQTARNEADFESVRGEASLTIESFIRWERVKLREAAREALALLESDAQPTREYLDYMFTTDVGLREIRTRIAKHRARLAELEQLKSDASLPV